MNGGLRSIFYGGIKISIFCFFCEIRLFVDSLILNEVSEWIFELGVVLEG